MPEPHAAGPLLDRAYLVLRASPDGVEDARAFWLQLADEIALAIVRERERLGKRLQSSRPGFRDRERALAQERRRARKKAQKAQELSSRTPSEAEGRAP